MARFLQKELPIRLAHRIQDFDDKSVLLLDSVELVKELYVQSFLDVRRFGSRIETSQQEASFAQLMERIDQRHSLDLVRLSRATEGTDFQKNCVNGILDRFYTCRIGLRVLMGQYLALRRRRPIPNHVGMICLQTWPHELVQQATKDATSLCAQTLGDAPSVIQSGNLGLTFPFVPTFLRKYARLRSDTFVLMSSLLNFFASLQSIFYWNYSRTVCAQR